MLGQVSLLRVNSEPNLGASRDAQRFPGRSFRSAEICIPFGWICRMTNSANMRLQLPPNEGMGSPPNRSFYVIWDHFEKTFLKFPETKRHEVKTKEQQQRISFGSVKHQTQKGESPDTVSICELMHDNVSCAERSENIWKLKTAGWIEFVFLNSGAKASFLQNIVLAKQLHDVWTVYVCTWDLELRQCWWYKLALRIKIQKWYSHRTLWEVIDVAPIYWIKALVARQNMPLATPPSATALKTAGGPKGAVVPWVNG